MHAPNPDAGTARVMKGVGSAAHTHAVPTRLLTCVVASLMAFHVLVLMEDIAKHVGTDMFSEILVCPPRALSEKM